MSPHLTHAALRHPPTTGTSILGVVSELERLNAEQCHTCFQGKTPLGICESDTFALWNPCNNFSPTESTSALLQERAIAGSDSKARIQSAFEKSNLGKCDSQDGL